MSDVFSFKVDGIDGKTKALGDFQGKPLLIVNTASECGYTPQYKGLQELFAKFQGRAEVLGFPCNEFGAQEPGNNGEIKEFCELRYKTSFPLLGKIAVKGSGKSALYQFLTTEGPQSTQGEVKWNFTKFLVDQKGKIVARFEPGVEPNSPEINAAIEALLK